MTPEEIQRIKKKISNPVYMKNGISNVADIYAVAYMKNKDFIDIEPRRNKMKETKKMSKITELENVLLNQIEMLNEEGILDNPEEAKIVIEKSKAISDLTRNFTDIQRMKLEVVKVAMSENGIYDQYLGIE